MAPDDLRLNMYSVILCSQDGAIISLWQRQIGFISQIFPTPSYLALSFGVNRTWGKALRFLKEKRKVKERKAEGKEKSGRKKARKSGRRMKRGWRRLKERERKMGKGKDDDNDDDEGRINFSVALSPKTTRTRNNKPKQWSHVIVGLVSAMRRC